MASIKSFLVKRDKVIRKILLSVIIILFIVFGLKYVNYLKALKQTELKEQNLIFKVGEKTLYLEVATTSAKQYLGLSKRPSLCNDCGMLFAFSSSREREFVMRDMAFPLDIIFISDNKIVKIYENLSPEGSSPVNYYGSTQPINYVLELNAGKASALGFKEGALIDLPVNY
jgi:hypothetical protein